MMTTPRALSREELRAIDRDAAELYGLPTLLLMENAGRGAAEYWRELAGTPKVAHRVIVLCGNGNNGGDGGVVARHLDAWGHAVEVCWFGHPERRSGDAQVQAEILRKSGIESVDAAGVAVRLAQADWVVDALLGTGLVRAVEGPIRQVIEVVNQAGKPVLALDLPSGLDADRGEPLGAAIVATATATFVGPKQGFSQPGAQRYCGAIRVIDIGVPRRLLEPYLGA